ncbi:hypothetical protein Pmani_027227 [Petrolisthes manimaculis]|uniref:Uncharacterized protein n=1 Tax=Petrolisthes manimaculis TaxID=1843537 RepID=A0AAE1TX23_9EUCA|nr:hypothetical protein Pmani_027227 [Petrolisthes manimaculis]
MRDYPDYKYRPRRKPKTLKKDGYPYSFPYLPTALDPLRNQACARTLPYTCEGKRMGDGEVKGRGWEMGSEGKRMGDGEVKGRGWEMGTEGKRMGDGE